jgi:SAC3 family protein LENG8/THP3
LMSSYPSQFPAINPVHSSSKPPSDNTLRKRKSSEMATDQDETNPPWRSNNKTSGSLADRISYAPTDKRQKMDEQKGFSKSTAALDHRKKRFEDARNGYSSPTTPRTPRGITPDAVPTGPVVGRSQKLEKNYFRLTAPPNAEDVRPLEVLRNTLDHLKKKWRSDENYSYICDQLKSLRQDLTVQHIKNDFTTTVYETHARIALEKGDLGEYNQCQTQLRSLYKQNLGGHPVEFKAYRILYFIHTRNRTDMNDVLSELTPADKKEPAIKHALEVRSALALGNFHKFFKLYLSVPGMGAYLMDMFVERERLAALAAISKS